MSISGRVTDFLGSWQRGHGKPHNPDHGEWGSDQCDACTAETHDAWGAFQHALWISGQQTPNRADHARQRVLDLFFHGVHHDLVTDDDERTCLNPLAMVTETRERGPSSSKIWVLADDRDGAELWMEGAGLAGLDTSRAERLLDPSQLRGAHMPFYVRTEDDEGEWPAMDAALAACGAIDLGPHLNAILARLEQVLGPVGEGGRRVGRPTSGLAELSAAARSAADALAIPKSRGEVDGS